MENIIIRNMCQIQFIPCKMNYISLLYFHTICIIISADYVVWRHIIYCVEFVMCGVYVLCVCVCGGGVSRCVEPTVYGHFRPKTLRT